MIETGYPQLLGFMGYRVKEIYDHATKTADRFGNSCLLREHLFLGILDVPESPAARMLTIMGVNVETFRSDLEISLRHINPTFTPSEGAVTGDFVRLMPPSVVAVLRDSITFPKQEDQAPRIGSEKLLINLADTQTGNLGAILRRNGVDILRAEAAFEILKGKFHS